MSEFAAQQISGHGRERVLSDAADTVTGAAEDLRRAAKQTSTDAAAATAAAAADAMIATARVIEGRHMGPLSRAADQFDHAARERYGRVPQPHSRAEGLRASARLIGALRRLHPRDEALQAAELLARLAALADTIALWRLHERRVHQSVMARRAAGELRTMAASLGVRTGLKLGPTSRQQAAQPHVTRRSGRR
jgi:hypothetical protein